MADDVSVVAGSYTATVGTKDVGSGREVQWVLPWMHTAVVTGNKSSISTSAVQIITGSTAALRGVLVRADEANTGLIWVGPSTVTAGTTDATDGYKLSAGENVELFIDNANKVYVIGSAAGQRVSWMVI